MKENAEITQSDCRILEQRNLEGVPTELRPRILRKRHCLAGADGSGAQRGPRGAGTQRVQTCVRKTGEYGSVEKKTEN